MPIPARRNHVPLRPPAAAAWVRNQLATSLRSRKPYSVNLLLGGFDPTSSTPSLYWIDYLGTLGTVPYAAHGYGAYFALSTMDRWHDPEGDLEKGLELLRKCIAELETRFIVNLGGWSIRGAFCHAFFFFFLSRAQSTASLCIKKAAAVALRLMHEGCVLTTASRACAVPLQSPTRTASGESTSTARLTNRLNRHPSRKRRQEQQSKPRQPPRR